MPAGQIHEANSSMSSAGNHKGHPHSPDAKARIGQSVAWNLVFNSRTAGEQELKFAYRYKKALNRIHELEDSIFKRQEFDAIEKHRGLVVKTTADCLAASGVMLWHGQRHALIWFNGCDQPVVWPLADLVIAEDAKEAAE